MCRYGCEGMTSIRIAYVMASVKITFSLSAMECVCVEMEPTIVG